MDPTLLSLDVLVPPDHPFAAGHLGAIFDHVGAAWRDALADLGLSDLDVHDGPATARRRGSGLDQLLAAMCYATVGRGEVLWRGRKLLGLAQRRRRHGVLVQCGLLHHWLPEPLLELLGGADGTYPMSLSAAERQAISEAAVGLAVAMEQSGLQAPGDDAIMTAVQRRLGWDTGPGGTDAP